MGRCRKHRLNCFSRSDNLGGAHLKSIKIYLTKYLTKIPVKRDRQ